MRTPLELALDTIADALAPRILERLGKLPATKRLLSMREAMAYLGYSRKTIRNLEASGELRAIKILKRNWRFDLRDLNALVEDSKSR